MYLVNNAELSESFISMTKFINLVTNNLTNLNNN